MNTKWAAFAKDEFTRVLKEKGIYGVSSNTFILKVKVDIEYGGQTLNSSTGSSTRSGRCTTVIELKNHSDVVQIKTKTKSRISTCPFGRNMDEMIEDNIKVAIEEFAGHL